MNRYLKLAAGLAAVIVIAVVGYSLLPKGPSFGGPRPSPTPSLVPSVAPTAVTAATPVVTCDAGATGCAGSLTAGTNSSVVFQPAMSFTVPAGWTNTFETERAYTLHYNFARPHFFQVLSENAIPEQNAACTAARKPGAGGAVADWVEFLTSHPGLEASTPEPVTIGGYQGMRLTLGVRTSWTATCPDSLGPAVMLITDSGPVPDRTRWIDDQLTAWWIVDVSGETVILYLESSPAGADLMALEGTFDPIIATFQFTPGS